MLTTIREGNELKGKELKGLGTNEMCRPTTSISCTSEFSIQSFHTAVDQQESNQCVNIPHPTDISDCCDEWSLISTKYLDDHAPQNATPSNFFYYGSLDGSSIPRSLAGSYFDYFNDDYEVVLDDGTRQKRSVSLSTIPLSTPYELKKSYKGNYNYAYYDENDIRGAKKNQTEEFYQRILEQERCRLMNTSTSTPDMIIQDLQPNESSDDENALDESYGQKQKPNAFTRLFLWLSQSLQQISLSDKQKMVLKCSFAYLLGSLFTFIPILNELLGTTRLSSHVIATVTVFFSPSKTIGGIIEAASYGLLYTICAMLVSLMSMWVAIYLRSRDYYVVSCVVTLGFWLAGSTFLLSFIKTRYNKPAIATGCGLGFMVIFPVLLKEGSEVPADFDSSFIEDMCAIVTIGTAISVAVCCIFWPMTATKKLKSDINDTLMAVRVLLKLLTKTFLLDTDLPEFTANENLQNAIDSHRASFTSLQSSLHDARKEIYNIDIWLYTSSYDSIVSSLQRLSQHIGGLRNSCGLQFEVMKSDHSLGAHKKYGTMDEQELYKEERLSFSAKSKIYNVKADEQRKKIENELRKEQTGHSRMNSGESDLGHSSQSRNSKSQNEGPLVEFIKTVRPPMKSLAYTCKQTIIHLQSHFTSQTNDSTPSFWLLKQNLATAIALFEESQNLALTRMYRRKMQKTSNSSEIKSLDLQSHLMNQFPVQDVFLVYFFVFCLLEFAKELSILVDSVHSVYGYHEKQSRNHFRVWGWVRNYLIVPFWFLFCCFYDFKQEDDTPFLNTQKKKKAYADSFVPNNNNTLNTLHTPKPKTKLHRLFLNLWGFFSWFRSHDVRFACKSTLIAVAIASMAFLPMTREYFQAWKMDWTLITVMAVMTPTVGGTNLVAVLRIFATMLGSIVAVMFYLFLPHDGPILLLFTWAFSIPCFWVSLNHRHGRFGTFSLLAYNLIVPFMFNHKNEEFVIDVVELALMRCATVSVGVIVGLVITTYVWPFEARKEMRKGLSDLLIRLSWLYKQLVSEYSDYKEFDTQNIGEDRHITSLQELDALAKRNEIRSFQFQNVELSLQFSLMELQDLLVHAPNEPRLKGPFPAKTYEIMLASCQSIMDKFLSIRIVILKDIWATQVRKDLMLPASQELMEMAGSVLLYFYLLASALQLKTPLPPYLPPAEKAREMLMIKLQQLPKITTDLKKNNDQGDSQAVKDECYMVYYSYVVMMESIIIELDKLGQQMKELFGSLVPDDQWARSFGLVDLERNKRVF